MKKWLLAIGMGACVALIHGQLVLPRKGIRRPIQTKWNISANLPPPLQIALRSAGHVRYSGTRVVVGKSGAERQEHTEYVLTDGPRTRIEFPAGSALAGQVIVEDGQQRKHFVPGKNEMRILPPRRDEAFGRLAQMAKRFTFTQQMGGNVAGIPTQLVLISDKMGNVLQRLWIDPSSGLILKREIYDKGGALQAAFEFKQVNLRPNIGSTDFNLQPRGVRVITPEVTLGNLIRKNNMADVRLPANSGYRLEGARMIKPNLQQVLVQQYVGGGHRIMLYQLRGNVDMTRLGRLARPEVRTYAWQASGSSFVLVGDVSDTELRQLATRLGG